MAIDWRRVPWTLWVLAIHTTVGVILVEVRVSGPVAPRVLYPFIMGAYLFFLFRRVRWLWIASIVLIPLGFAQIAIEGTLSWYGALAGVVALVLLLLPITRRYFAKPEREGRSAEVTVAD